MAGAAGPRQGAHKEDERPTKWNVFSFLHLWKELIEMDELIDGGLSGAESPAAGTAANQSNQSNKNKIILFFFVDD